jgi:hypothetical protein
MLAILLLACHAPSTAENDSVTPFEPIPEDSRPPEDTGTEPPPPPEDVPAVVFNEFQSDNDSTLQEKDGSFSDWFELYNASFESVGLNRIEVWSNGVAWRGGTGDLAAGAVVLVKADGGLSAGSAPWRLASAGGERFTVTVDGVQTDTLLTPALPGDVAALRFPDGEEWRIGIQPTPGASNVETGTDSTDPRDGLFQCDRVTELNITLTPEAMDTLRTSFKEEVEATIEFDGITFPRVALKLKGSGSYQEIDGKAAFKIDLNDYDDTRRMRGLKKLTFNNGVSYDPTWTHEYLTYSLFRAAGIAAPRVGWTRIQVNGADYGLYMNIETWDDELLERWFDDADKGSLYEGGWWDLDSSSAGYFKLEEGAARTDWLNDVGDHVSGSVSSSDMDALETLIDMDEFTTYMAVEAITLMNDGYRAPNNWRLYMDSNDVGRWLPTGVDYTWTYRYGNCYFGNGNVFVACMGDNDCRDLYSEKLIEVADIADSLNLDDEFEAITDFLEHDIETDHRTPHDPSTIASAQETTRELLEQMPAECREQAEDELAESPPAWRVEDCFVPISDACSKFLSGSVL